MSTELPQDQKYLSVDKQHDIANEILRLAETEPLRKTLLFKYSSFMSAAPALTLYMMAWRAGFRGYGLSKYGKARVISIVAGLVFPINGAFAHEMWAQPYITEPYRPENPWSHGLKFALIHQVGTIPSIIGGLGFTFIIATKTGILPIPDGIHRKGVREIAARLFFARVKPYRRPLAWAVVGSTAFMYLVGVGSYLQSCRLLAKIGRKTLILKED